MTLKTFPWYSAISGLIIGYMANIIFLTIGIIFAFGWWAIVVFIIAPLVFHLAVIIATDLLFPPKPKEQLPTNITRYAWLTFFTTALVGFLLQQAQSFLSTASTGAS